MIKGLFYYDGRFEFPPLSGIGELEAEADIAYDRRTYHGRHKPNFLRECLRNQKRSWRKRGLPLC